MVDARLEELLGGEENRGLLDGLERASQRVSKAWRELAEIESREAEARADEELHRTAQDQSLCGIPEGAIGSKGPWSKKLSGRSPKPQKLKMKDEMAMQINRLCAVRNRLPLRCRQRLGQRSARDSNICGFRIH
ncbi:hypothetical protein BT93_L2407 [Corymbia citriodora subsp. variegata]|uniref:Uncharacterized protein n=1 Tax=Corymbia citriodora subsp. variegata TaxID=360336 RepID=A0A8T0CP47_CORYI|nr:hypothetical protein BT93_L2407 [Corymbia citriodora subsp. variegata]KAF7847967.1 hypothetical protein BT93_L2407 [Corymbia citriodora subsp. variegata]